MSGEYGYILAELLKRNTELHGKALKKRGNKHEWPHKARKVMIVELASYPKDNALKAFSGLIWGRLRLENITTRQIYALLLQWALTLSEKKLLVTYTDDYLSLVEELRDTIESGAEGIVEDIPPEEIIEEWEFMKGYLDSLHMVCEEWVNKRRKKRD